MDVDGLSRVIASRRSVRAYRPDPPPDAVVDALLADAVAAPSPSNQQPWRFVVVTSRPTIEAMAGAVRAAVARIADHVTDEGRDAFVAYGDYFVRFEAAPVVIAAVHRGRRVLEHLVGPGLDPADRARIVAMERDSALAATAMAVQNLLLSASARGLGASAMTGPMVAADALLALLGVPDGWGIAAIVPVGYPAEDPRPTPRKDVARVTRWLR